MTVTGDRPKLDGTAFDTPSTTKTEVAVVDRSRGPVFRTVHPRTLSEREGSDDRALRLLIRRTTPPPACGGARGAGGAGHGRSGHTRAAMRRATGK